MKKPWLILAGAVSAVLLLYARVASVKPVTRPLEPIFPIDMATGTPVSEAPKPVAEPVAEPPARRVVFDFSRLTFDATSGDLVITSSVLPTDTVIVLHLETGNFTFAPDRATKKISGRVPLEPGKEYGYWLEAKNSREIGTQTGSFTTGGGLACDGATCRNLLKDKKILVTGAKIEVVTATEKDPANVIIGRIDTRSVILNVLVKEPKTLNLVFDPPIELLPGGEYVLLNGVDNPALSKDITFIW
jgi:hypothetical protein